MADYTIINGTDAELTNVNAGGTDVPARTVQTTITLTDAELAAVCVQNGVGVMQTAPTAAEKGSVFSALIDNLIADVDLSTPAARLLFKLKLGLDEFEQIAAAI